jgi:hypothetical protein
MSYSLEFRAWIGQQDEIDPDDPTEFLDASFADLNEAKSKIYNNCIK